MANKTIPTILTNEGNVGIGISRTASLNTTTAVNGTGGGNRGFDAGFTGASATGFTGSDSVDQGYGYFAATIVSGRSYEVSATMVVTNGAPLTLITSTGLNFATQTVQEIQVPPVSNTTYRFAAIGNATFVGVGFSRTSGTMTAVVSNFSIKEVGSTLVTSESNVGIGITNPEATSRLHIKNLDAASKVTIESANNSESLINFSAQSSEYSIGFVRDGSNVNSFRFCAADSLSAGEVMRLQDGNVGIGTTNPSYLIDVYKTSNDAVIRSRTTAAGAYLYLDSATDGWFGVNLLTGNISKWFMGGYGTSSFTITRGIGGAEYLRIDTAGNVGIGTTNPGAKLDVAGSLRVTGIGQIGPVGGYGIALFNAGTNTFIGQSYGRASGIQFTDAAGLNTVYIANGGKVGIGTTNPLALLSVGAGSLNDGNVPIQISSAGPTTERWIGVNRNGSYGLILGYYEGSAIAGSGAYVRQVSADPLHFAVNNTSVAMSILSNTNIGIGTTNPSQKLDVNGAIIAGINNSYGAYTRTPGGVVKPWFATSGPNTFFYNTNLSGSIFWQNAADTTSLMVLSEQGRLGINTNDASGKLHVLDASLYAPSLTWNAAAATIIRSENGQIAFGSDDTTPYGIWQQVRTSSSTARPLLLNPLGGNVGVGVRNPTKKLQVAGSLYWDLNGTSAEEHIVGIQRVVAAANGAFTEIGTLAASANSIRATFEIFHHDSGTIEYSLFELIANYYTGTTTDWVQLPSRTQAHYAGVANGVVVDARLQTTGGSVELRLRSIGGAAAAMTVNVRIKSNTNLTETSATGTGATVAGLLGFNGYEFPVTNDRFKATVDGLFIKNNGFIGVGTTNPSTLLSIGRAGSTTAASGLTFGGDAQANLYRAAEDTIKTDGSLNVAGLIYNGNSAYYSSVSKSTTANWGQYTVVLGNASYSANLIQVSINGGNLVWAGTFLASCHLSYRPNETWINVKLLECATYNCSNDDVNLLALSNSTTSQYGIPALVLKTNGAISAGYGTGSANNITVTVNGPSPNEFVLSSSSWAQPYTYQIATSANTKQIFTNEAGRVGIGTVFPVQKFQIDGTVGNPASVGTTQSGIFRISNTTDNATLDFGIRAGGNGAWIQSTDETSLAANYPLLLNPNGGNVGIGTTNPTGRLSVDFAGASAFNVCDSFSSNVRVTVGTVNDAGTTYGLIQTYQHNTNSAGVSPLTIQPFGGNVGIGITNASALFYVFSLAGRYINFTPTSISGLLVQRNQSIGSQGTTVLTLVNAQGPESTADRGTSLNLDIGYGGTSTTTAGTIARGARIAALNHNVYDATAANQNAYLAFYTATGGALTEQLRITANGNVGIGTTNPTAKLQVVQSNAGGVAAILLSSDESTIQGPSANTQIRMGSNLVLNGSNILTLGTNNVTRMVIDVTGNVGIGTVAPTAQNNYKFLQVNGQNSAIIEAMVNNVRIGGIDSDSSSLYFGSIGSFPIVFRTAVVEKMRITAAGLVGIGTATPNTLLSVGGAGSTLPASGITFGGNSVANLYRSEADHIKTDGSFVVTNTLIVGGGQNGIRILKNGSDSISSNLYIANAANTRAYNFQPNAAGTNLALWTYNSANAWQNSVNFNYNGSVGIGTTAPSGKLHIVSTIAGETVLRADGTNGTLFSVVDDLSDSLMSVNNSAGLPVLEVFADDRVVAGQYGSGDFVLINNKVGLGTSNPINKLSVIGGASIGSNTYNFAAPSNGLIVEGNVGIGTTNPVSKLHVKSSLGQDGIMIDAATYSEVAFKLNGGTAKSYLSLSSVAGGYIIGSSANSLIIRNDSDIFMSADAGVTSNITIKNNGNVGIGLTNPAYRLQVSGGDVSINSANILRFGTVSVLNTNSNANDIYANIRVIRNESTVNQDGMYVNYNSNGGAAAHLRFYANASTERMRIDASNGYVGVGTTVPDVKFDVYDDLNGGNISAVRNANTGSNAYTALVFRRNSNLNGLVMFTNSSNRSSDGGLGNSTIRTDNGKLLLGAGASTYHSLETNGNVGIGLTNPAAARLHIKGDGTNPVLRVETADLQSAAGGTASKTFVGWMPIMTGAAVGDKVFIPLFK